MQHAALDSILNSLKFTGTPFPAVSSTFNPPDQNEANFPVRSALTGSLFARMGMRLVAARPGNTADACNTVFRVSGSTDFPNNKFQKNQRPRYRTGGELLRERRGIWERLWLMLEVERGLEVQV